jgi:hypothetical protein
MTDTPMMVPNMELVDKVFLHIRNRDHWNQRRWSYVEDQDKPLNAFDYALDENADENECGSTMCFGGWACTLAKNVKVTEHWAFDPITPLLPDGSEAMGWFQAAAMTLGFNPYLAEKVFFNYSDNIDEFETEVREAIAQYGHLTRAQVAELYETSTNREYNVSYVMNFLFEGVGGNERFNDDGQPE